MSGKQFGRMIRAADDGESDGVMTFIASTPGTKRDGLKIDQSKWDTRAFRV